MGSYDRSDWHSGGNYPKDLPPENGGTHIGMFLAWCILNNLQGEFHDKESADSLRKVRERSMTGRNFLSKECDEKFWEEDLNDEGNRFAHAYYGNTPEDEGQNYFSDYDRLFSKGLPSVYHLADTWENYDLIAPVITLRFQAWKSTGSVLFKKD